jgi:hypothetical protein
MWRRLREWMAPPSSRSAAAEGGQPAGGIERPLRTPPITVVDPAVGAPVPGRGVLGQRRPAIRFGRGASSPPAG